MESQVVLRIIQCAAGCKRSQPTRKGRKPQKETPGWTATLLGPAWNAGPERDVSRRGPRPAWVACARK